MERSVRSLRDKSCSKSRLTRRGGGLSLLAIRVGRPAVGQVPRLDLFGDGGCCWKLVLDEDSAM
jgi:hypothetical protein